MKKLNITKGECKVHDWEEDGTDAFHIRPSRDFTALIATVHRWIPHIGKREAKANAELIADAFNTANQTGLTPSELLKQRDKLLEALKAMTPQFKSWKLFDKESNGYRWATKAENAIKSITKEQ